MRLYLARHAQTPSNVARALDTARPGAPLTDLGLRQAARLKDRFSGVTLSVVAASPLRRAQQTAAPLAAARGLAVRTFDGLREVDAGELEMDTSDEAAARYVALLHAWAGGDLDAALPGGISGHDFTGRFDDAILGLEDEAARAGGGAALAVSHGAALRTWAAIRCAGPDPVSAARRRLANTSVIVLEGSSRDGWRLDARIEDHLDTGVILDGNSLYQASAPDLTA